MSHLGKKITWRFDRLAQEYDEWYRTPLGSLSDALGKNALFSLTQIDKLFRRKLQNASSELQNHSYYCIAIANENQPLLLEKLIAPNFIPMNRGISFGK